MTDYYYIVIPILDKKLGDVVLLSEEEAEDLKKYVQHYPEYREVKRRQEIKNGNIRPSIKEY